MKTESITLYYRQEKSDKVYKVSLEEKDGDFIVNFAYGRRGNTLKTGTKTQSPVPYEKAKKIYDKLVQSKSAKAYVPDEDNTTAYIVDLEQRKKGIHCQLLNPIDTDVLQELMQDDAWCLQEKKDGKRMLIQKTETETIAINRKGLSIGAPESILSSANNTPKTFVIDGEAIDEHLFAFDILSYDGKSVKDKPKVRIQIPLK